MELGDKDKFGQEKRGGDSVNYHSPGLSSDWRFGSSNLSNTFDGNLDTLVAALNRLGYGQMPIVIGEIGWPTDGALGANLTAARAFNQGVINHVLSSKGTPLRPGIPPMDKSCPSVGECRFLVGISETKSSSFRHRHCWFLMWVITVWLFEFLRII